MVDNRPARCVGVDVSFDGTGLVERFDSSVRDLLIQTKPKDFVTRMSRIRRVADTVCAFMLDGGHPVTACIEGYSFGSKFGREAAGELGGYIRMRLWEAGVDLIEVPPSTLKVFVTGSGKAEKNLMLRDVYRRWGYVAECDDMSDAYALSVLGRQLLEKGREHKFYTKCTFSRGLPRRA